MWGEAQGKKKSSSIASINYVFVPFFLSSSFFQGRVPFRLPTCLSCSKSNMRDFHPNSLSRGEWRSFVLQGEAKPRSSEMLVKWPPQMKIPPNPLLTQKLGRVWCCFRKGGNCLMGLHLLPNTPSHRKSCFLSHVQISVFEFSILYMKCPPLTGLLSVRATLKPRNNCGSHSAGRLCCPDALLTLGNPFWTKDAKVNTSHSISSSNPKWPRKRQLQEINSPNISPDTWACSPSRCGRKTLNSHVFLKHASCTQTSQDGARCILAQNSSYYRNSHPRDYPAPSPQFPGLHVASSP